MARTTAAKARTQAANALRALLVTAPVELREQLRDLDPSKLAATAARLHIERDHSLPAVERDRIYQRDDRRHDLFAADASQFLLHPFRVRDALDAKLVVHPEDYRPAVGIREGDDALRDALRIGQAHLQFEVRILAAPYQA